MSSMWMAGGVRVAAADLDGNGRAEIVTAPGPGGGPNIRLFTKQGQAIGTGFMAGSGKPANGTFVTAGDLNGDGQAEIAVINTDVFQMASAR